MGSCTLEDKPILSKALADKATSVLDAARAADVMIVTAESCTGGMIAAALTAIVGSSAVVDRGFVTYTNEAKSEMLGVPDSLIDAHGAVSEPVARAMAEGALRHSRADIAVSVTGIAGPGGATATKPVGLVHLAVACKGRETVSDDQVFAGDRANVREAAAIRALDMTLKILKEMPVA